MLVYRLTSVLSPYRALGERGRQRGERVGASEKRYQPNTTGNKSLRACRPVREANSSLRAGSVGPPFGLHSQNEQQTQQDLCRERKTVLPKFPQGKVWEQCAFFEPKPFTSSPARSWPCFQKVLCGCRTPALLTVTNGGQRDTQAWQPHSSCAVQQLSKQSLQLPTRPSHSRRMCERILPILSFLLILGSDQNAIFSRVTGAERRSECQMPG